VQRESVTDQVLTDQSGERHGEDDRETHRDAPVERRLEQHLRQGDDDVREDPAHRVHEREGHRDQQDDG
jgi:hypothetical protein